MSNDELKKKPEEGETNTEDGTRGSGKSKISTDDNDTPSTRTGGGLINSPLPPTKEK